MRGGIGSFAFAHLEGCARLFVSVFRAEPWDEPWTLEAACGRLSRLLRTPGSFGLVCYGGGEPDGFALRYRRPYLDSELFLLEEMCVRPEAQGSGIGTALLKGLHAELGRSGVERFALLTMKEGSSRAFYE